MATSTPQPPLPLLTAPEPGTPESWAERRPDAIAIIDGDRQLTYTDWNDKANRLADALAELGVKPQDRIGMRFQLRTEWFILQRALQKLGAGQVAISWKLQTEEVLHILRDSGAVGLACTDPDPIVWTRHPETGLLITVRQPATSNTGHRIEDLVNNGKPTPRYGARDPLNVIYSSGTTGAPRGISRTTPSGVDPKWMARYRRSMADRAPTIKYPVSLQTGPVNHASGFNRVVSVNANGGTNVLLDKFDPERALQLIEEHKVQTWSAVPTMLLRLQNLPDEVFSKYDLSSLRMLSVGAAPVPQSLKRGIIERMGDNLLWEAYGASEVGVISMATPEVQLSKPGTCGKPFQGVDVAIVDQDWNHLPTDQTGEIAVKSPKVLRAYVGQDKLPDGMINEGYCRTGDIGHLDEDGFIFITDRAKDMIVAGGVNIYPAEIESALVEHPRIVDAAVIGIPHEDFGEQPLAFIVPTDPASPPSHTELDTFLTGRLAKFKSPRKYVYLAELPTNAAGKVLKTDLRKPYWEGRERNV
jgi:long-chain acyl-CoA synthetase